MMNKCIFCKKDTRNSKSVEHIIPESLGANLTLPRGFVCDLCNNYFSHSIDKALQEYRFIGILKSFLVGRTKKGKGPQIDLGNLIIKHNSLADSTSILPRGAKIHHNKTDHSITIKFSREKCNIQLVSRAIYKIIFELRCKEYGLSEIMQDKYDSMRKYIREPKLNEYWNFAQKPHPMGNKIPFDYSFNTKYSNTCSILRIFDVEFIVEQYGKLPVDKLRKEEYEIISKEEIAKIVKYSRFS